VTVGTLLIVGHCTIDTIHLPDGTELRDTVGGAAAYAAAGAAVVGADVVLASRVGADYPVDRLEPGLSSAGRVDATHVQVLAERSIHNDAWYGADGSRRWEIESWPTLELLMPEPRDLPRIRTGPALITPAPTSQQQAIVRSFSGQCPIAIDTEVHYLRESAQRSGLLDLVSTVDYFLPSIEHLCVLFDDESREPLDYLTRLSELDARVVAVKHGVSGSTVIDFPQRRAWRVPAVADVRVEDPTGAGDAYNGGFLAAAAGAASLLSAACWGSVAASFAIGYVGATSPTEHDRAESRRRFRELRARVVEQTLPVTWAAGKAARA
jgi:cytidine kinase